MPKFKAARTIDQEVEARREKQLRAYIDRWDAYETAPIPDFYDSVMKQSRQQALRMTQLLRSFSETRHNSRNSRYE